MQVVVGQRPGGQDLPQPHRGGVGVVRAERVEHRQGRHALAQVGAGRLARLHRLRGDVEQVVGELEGHADGLAVAGQRLGVLRGGTAEHAAEAGRRGDQRTGLARDHVEVVGHRVVAGAGTDGLGDLTVHQPREGARLEAYGLDAQVGGDVGGASEEVVADEDGDRVGPPGVGARRAPAHGGLVHHVVVVERRQVGELHHHGGRHDLWPCGIAELGAQRHQQRAEPLAAGLHEVPGGLRHERVGAGHARPQLGLDALQQAQHGRLDAGIGEIEAERAELTRAHPGPTAAGPGGT